MKYQNDDDDDNMVYYDSSVDKAQLWEEIRKLKDRVNELERKLSEFRQSNRYFGDK
jgi:hypothetical protein